MTRDIFLLLLLGISVPLSLSGQDAKYAGNSDYLSYVNILQGTDSNRGLSHGNTVPLVGMPWGMTDWAIQSEDKGAWFFKPNGKLAGFRATHEPSPWMGDYGHFILMPQSGDLKMDFPSRMSDYDTTTSLFRPDYERLDLKKDQILAELTATERCAVFRLTFHQGNTGRLILNTFGDTDFQIQSRTIRGITTNNSGGVPKDFALYFVIALDRDIVKSETFKHALTTDPAKVDGVAGYVEFNTAPADPVEVRVGTSFISYDQAEQNLKAETTGGFDAVRARVRDTWEHNLGRVEVEANEDQKKTFYSCLYRAQMFPHRLYELDSTGKAVHFSPYDDKVHPGVLYGDTGIWDAFRTTFPLIAILYPAQVAGNPARFCQCIVGGRNPP